MPISTISQAGLDAPISLTSPTLTTPNINSAQIATVSGTAPLYLARAWVNFNGTGTVAIRASGNVTSITDNGVGDYTVNFTNAMPDANFAVNVNYSPIYGTYYCAGARLFGNTALSEVAPSVNNFRFVTHFITGNEQDPKYVIVSVFR